MDERQRSLLGYLPWLIGGAVGGFVLFWASVAAGATAHPRPTRILLVGDSLAVGLASELRRLAATDGVAVVGVEAIVSTRLDQWAPKMPVLLAQYKPDLVLVSLGTNDAGMSVPTSNAGAASSIVSAIGAAGARAFWIGMPTLPSRLQADVVRQMIQATGVNYFDSRNVSFERAGDGIHATTGGYAAWMQAMWPSVLRS